LLEPTSGKMTWPESKPRIGFVFQDPTLMPWADALTNVRLPLDLEGVNRPDAGARAMEALNRLGLAEFAHAFPRALSGGMRMRVSIARALAAKPQLLLMDEPFAALDEISREALNEDLLKLWREDGLTIVFVTHSIYESAFLSSRVAVMSPRPGRITKTLDFHSPATRDSAWRLTPDFADAAKRVSVSLRGAPVEAA
jgi:NitT/TauT family transport system ATP-binding protein